RGAAITAGVAAAGVSGYGIWRAYAPPEVRRLQVPLARLDRRADGLRVAVIADLHVSPMFGSRQVERVVDLVNSLDADLVTVVGDLVSTEVGEVARSAAPLRAMRSRYGTFFVTGNHEYYHGYQEWLAAADQLGLRVLRNQRVEIAHRGGAIDLAGVNDREGSGYGDPPDYPAALGDRDPSRPVLLLAHQPVQAHRAAEFGVDLQLSGHTHGGQLYPFDYLVRLDQPAVSGLADVDGTLVYVTNGAGFWGPPMRVGADPDVTLIELRSPD
ncbi:MAG: metallophosphoesterase, partial [Natronosporangium sp.]